MKSTSLLLFLFIFVGCIIVSCSTPDYEVNWISPENIEVNNSVEGILYEAGNWEEPSYGPVGKHLGNHRAVIAAPPDQEVIWLHLPWRRRDGNLVNKGIIITNAGSTDTVRNMIIKELNEEYVDIIFQPLPASETHHVYYFPFETTGSYYPTVNYIAQQDLSDPAWRSRYESLDRSEMEMLSGATVESIQSINDFHSFFPMEIAATSHEVDSFLRSNPSDYYLFPEFRENPTRMTKKLPYHWITRGLKNGISDQAKKGEYYVFQVAVYSAIADLNDLQLSYSDLESGSNSIVSSQITCFNIDGVDLYGEPFSKKINILEGQIQPLWFGVEVPEDTQPGSYTGMIITKPRDFPADTVHLKLRVIDELIEDYGDNEPQKMSRLRWFNSTLGSEDDFIISPFTPVAKEENSLRILGRKIDLGETGLPSQIHSYFKEEMTGLKEEPESILAGPIEMRIEKGDQRIDWKSTSFDIRNSSPSQAEWSTVNESDEFLMNVSGALEYDGMLNYELMLIAKMDVEVESMKLVVPYTPGASEYILGLGFKGSKRPEGINWKWDITNHHEGVWLGGVNKGLQYVLRDVNYQRPLNTNFYQNQPLKLPHSWYNEGMGGIRITEDGQSVLCENYSGPRSLQKGDTLNFHIRFLITPFKTIDIKTHFNTRFVHKYVPVDSVKELGGTVVNVHHANEINPYINYPFFNLDLQKEYIDEAHDKGVKVKLYNTIRELTYKSYELFPMRSLGFEIFNDGEGGGHPWLQEHLEEDYHKAWHAWRVNDAAILNKGTSRWTNYYIEGLNWLAKNQEIDGLYLDDIAFSRETVKRMVAVLNQHRENVIIDLHSANQYNERDGFINSAFLYMEHFPYISRLWFGEYFEYDLDPEYWLTEVSGIPFGLTGEMLQDGGHPFRGMVYGMTTRVYGKYSPQAIWKLFDSFQIMESEMIGYWVSTVPIKTNNQKVPATVYKKDDEILLAIGSWSDQDEMIELEIDWNKLPFTGPDQTRWIVPGVEGLQEERSLEAGKPIRVERGQGLLVIISESR